MLLSFALSYNKFWSEIQESLGQPPGQLRVPWTVMAEDGQRGPGGASVSWATLSNRKMSLQKQSIFYMEGKKGHSGACHPCVNGVCRTCSVGVCLLHWTRSSVGRDVSLFSTSSLRAVCLPCTQ